MELLTPTRKDTAAMTHSAFTRKLRNLEGMFARLDQGQLDGRNSASSDAWRRRSYEMLRDAIEADARMLDAPLCTWLDENPKVAARWNRIERRSVGLPV